MKEETQPDNWQQKLEELDSIPDGIQFRSANTWNQIESKLQQPAKRKLAWWHYAAAAVLLLFISIIAFQKNRHTYEVAITKPEQALPQIKANTKKENITQETEILTTIEKKSTSVKSTVKTELHKNKINPNKEDSIANVIINVAEKESLTTTAISQINAVEKDTVTVAANKIIPKQTLRVLHINELYAPVPALESDAEKTSWLTIKAPFSNHVKNTSADNIQAAPKRGLMNIRINKP